MCKRGKDFFGGRKKFCASIFTFIAGMFIALGILTFAGNTVKAEENLPVGTIFYDEYFKYRVTKEVGVEYTWPDMYDRPREEYYGKAQIVGLNPEQKGFVGTIYIPDEVYGPGNGQRFIIDSIGKNAFANTRISGVDIDTFVALSAEKTYRSELKLLNGCFKNCKDLEYVKFANSPKGGTVTVNKNAFKGCKKLKYIGISCFDNKEDVERSFNFKKGAFPGIKNVTIVHSRFMNSSYSVLNTSAASEVYKAFAKKVRKGGARKIKYRYQYRWKKLK